MKKIAAFILIVCLTTSVQAETFALDDGKITFEAPEGFKPISDEIVKLKYPSNRAPKFVIGNSSAATTIAYDLKDNKIPADRLDEVRLSFEKTFSRVIPGVKWIENKLIDHAGRKWIFFELTSAAIDTDIHNIVLVTSYEDKMLMFNFNSTKQQFSQYEKELRKSIQSISFK